MNWNSQMDRMFCLIRHRIFIGILASESGSCVDTFNKEPVKIVIAIAVDDLIIS